MLEQINTMLWLDRFARWVADFFQNYSIDVTMILTANFWLTVLYIIILSVSILIAYKLYTAYYKVLKVYVQRIDEILFLVAKLHSTAKFSETEASKGFNAIFESKKKLIDEYQNYIDYLPLLITELEHLEKFTWVALVSWHDIDKIRAKQLFITRMYKLYNIFSIFLSIATLWIYWLWHKRLHY